MRARESGGRRCRQPGQVRKEAATTISCRVVPAPTARQAPKQHDDDESPGLGLDLPEVPQPRRRLALSRARPQIPAAELRRADRPGRDGADARQCHRQRGRIAHAFLLTGVRGVGKTSTARLVAKALNCIGPDGQGGPTIDPCGQCEPCRAIAEGRHIDVIEMDAASHTGVDDVREIIEAVRYASVSARYKIYIIDEVHMLSKNAFNALLKTLEEPPEHVKFLFATTEVNKVPVTVLSRCQRFDLRRIPAEKLAHFAEVAEIEQVEVEPEALADDRPGGRRLGARRPVDPRPGDRPWRRTVTAEAGARHARPRRPRAHPALLVLLLAGDARAALAELDEAHALGIDPRRCCAA
jgi:DNA polymerase-3 subunit gamma/tau